MDRYIEGNVKFIGSGKWCMGECIPQEKKGLPVQKIDVIEQMKIQTRAYERILKELKLINTKREEIKNLIS